MKKIIIKHLEDIKFNLENDIYNNMFEKEDNQSIHHQLFFISVIIFFVKSNNFNWNKIKKNYIEKGDK
tara:strand:+ start:522 stop:725 length:204 start_codon:yes stop_codon:yes gene_type:complete